jgi:hypothetical protein
MGDSITISMGGMDTVLGNIGKITPMVASMGMKIITDGAQGCFDDSQYTVPVDKGDLKASGRIVYEEGVITVGYGEGLPDERQWYNEIGTVHMAANPYLFPAFLSACAKIEADLNGML